MTKQERQHIAYKKYYEKNKERLNAENRKRYLENKDKINKYQREYYHNNKEEIGKTIQRNRRNAPENNLYTVVKNRCKLTGQEFSITKEDIIIPEYCPLLGIKLDTWGIRDGRPSLDRLDNTKGYIPGNVWVISVLANTMKNKATKEQLILFAQNILSLMKED